MVGTDPPKNITGGMNILSGYHRGHLLAASLGGSNTDARNFVPMSPRTNTSNDGMVQFESPLRKALKSKKAAGPPPYIISFKLTADYDKTESGLQTWLNKSFPGAHPNAAVNLYNLAKDNTELTRDTLHQAIDSGNGQVTKAKIGSKEDSIRHTLAMHFMPTSFKPEIEAKQPPDLSSLKFNKSFDNHQ